MNCIKCGVKVKEPQVFCADCLADMEKYPVKPNVTIQLPVRPAVPPAKKKIRRQKYTSPEDQVRHLKFQRRCLSLALVVSLIAFILTAVMLLYILDTQKDSFLPGQNYGTMETADST